MVILTFKQRLRLVYVVQGVTIKKESYTIISQKLSKLLQVLIFSTKKADMILLMHTKVYDGRILTFGQNRVSVKRFKTGRQHK